MFFNQNHVKITYMKFSTKFANKTKSNMMYIALSTRLFAPYQDETTMVIVLKSTRTRAVGTFVYSHYV